MCNLETGVCDSKNSNCCGDGIVNGREVCDDREAGCCILALIMSYFYATINSSLISKIGIFNCLAFENEGIINCLLNF